MDDLLKRALELIDPEVVLTGILWLIVFAALFFLACLLIRKKQSRGRRCWFVGVNAILLTVFTVGVAGEFPLLLSAQAGLMDSLYRLKGIIHKDETIWPVLDDKRLWLVDVSHDVSLVADPDMTATWGSQQVITDRRKLTWLLRGLAQDPVSQYVDLVVCDLTFGMAGDAVQDQELKAALRRLNARGKLLVAHSALAENRGDTGSTVVDADSLCGGQVDIATYFGGSFYAYPLFGVTDSTRSEPSLAYAIYRRLARGDTCCTGTDKASDEWPIMRQFIPDYLVDDSDVAGSDETSDTLSAMSGQLMPYRYRLGQLAAFRVNNDTTLTNEFDPEAMAPFVSELAGMNRKGLRNIVFVGIFDGNERDMHKTAVGPMHGSIILVNALLNLLNGAHRITWLYVFLLLIGFAVISRQFLQLEIRKPHEAASPPEKPDCKKKESIWQKASRIVDAVPKKVGNWVVDKQVYLLTLGLLLIMITVFNHLINIAVVELHLAVNAFLLKEFCLMDANDDSKKPATDLPSRRVRA